LRHLKVTTIDSTEKALKCVQSAPALRGHKRSLKLVLAITVAMMVAEVLGGWFANSLALLADAGHMLTDAAAIGLALFAAWISERPPTANKTFGYLRLEVLAALVNGATLFVLAGLIVWHAIDRFVSPPAVEPQLMLGVAAVGLVANVVALKILHGGHEHSLNIRGAFLHVLGDLLGSVGALIAGVIILTTGWMLADPITSIVIAALILGGAWRLVRDSVDVLLEATPRSISLQQVADRISSIPDILEVHDLHVWTVTSGVIAMSGHAIVAEPSRNQAVLETVQRRMAELGINHVTVQIEDGKNTCAEGGI
jgi:cobalt-zinc-cadmium efflux system protein